VLGHETLRNGSPAPAPAPAFDFDPPLSAGEANLFWTMLEIGSGGGSELEGHLTVDLA